MARNASCFVNFQTVELSKTLFGIQQASPCPCWCQWCTYYSKHNTGYSALKKIWTNYCTQVKCAVNTDYLRPPFSPNHGLCIFSFFDIFALITVWVTQPIKSADINYSHFMFLNNEKRKRKVISQQLNVFYFTKALIGDISPCTAVSAIT